MTPASPANLLLFSHKYVLRLSINNCSIHFFYICSTVFIYITHSAATLPVPRRQVRVALPSPLNSFYPRPYPLVPCASRARRRHKSQPRTCRSTPSLPEQL
ncbi:hypothetical protein PAHAL_3G247000 [Panicum hallii]|uniref:Uncharacterized protein n=1 Tax=Panicum hallii TaxID=206008 RepID=A0A2T8KJ82_9POAL|nr:hypothetical protein PAHAL_3G247000 [Panicum hallii]